MEAAPLTLAHAHARRASHETARSKLTVAATEHESAALQFGKAADTTLDYEALRILNLLQHHHNTLAAVIRTKDIITHNIPTAATTTTEDKLPSSPSTADASAPHHQSRPSASALSKVSQQQRREASPALAKDMASRRGIPQPIQKKTHPPADVRSSFTPPPDVTAPRRKHATKYHEIVEAPAAESTASIPSKPSEPTADEGFSRFYANLSSGPLAKISSMLAFAALPLTEPPPGPPSPTSSRAESVKAYSGPDARALISPAALRALEEQHRRQGASGQVFNPAESFYVVQPSGGTASYANIMRSEHRHAKRQHGHHLSGISEENLEFVDARETQASKSGGGTSASHAKTADVASGAGVPQGGHRVEELELENDTLKQVLDQMSHRLQAFERSAQDASMAALTQSMASVRTVPGMRADEMGGDRERIMEAELQNAVDEITRLKAENKEQRRFKEELEESVRVKRREERREERARRLRE